MCVDGIDCLSAKELGIVQCRPRSVTHIIPAGKPLWPASWIAMSIRLVSNLKAHCANRGPKQHEEPRIRSRLKRRVAVVPMGTTKNTRKGLNPRSPPVGEASLGVVTVYRALDRVYYYLEPRYFLS